MKYMNIRTSVIVETDCVISGSDWQEILPAGQNEEKKNVTGNVSKHKSARKPVENAKHSGTVKS